MEYTHDMDETPTEGPVPEQNGPLSGQDASSPEPEPVQQEPVQQEPVQQEPVQQEQVAAPVADTQQEAVAAPAPSYSRYSSSQMPQRSLPNSAAAAAPTPVPAAAPAPVPAAAPTAVPTPAPTTSPQAMPAPQQASTAVPSAGYAAAAYQVPAPAAAASYQAPAAATQTAGYQPAQAGYAAPGTGAPIVLYNEPKKALSVFKLIAAVVFIYFTMLAQGISYFIAADYTDDILQVTLVYEIVGSVFAIIAMIILGSCKNLGFSWKEVGQAFKDCWWLVLIDTFTAAYYIFELYTYDELYPIDGWQGYLIITFFLCLFIGISEEAMFRGLLQSGLQGIAGKTKVGLIVTAVLSSLVFGLVHVIPFDPADLTPMGITQMILKTLQTGVCGLLWVSVVLKSGSFWGVALVHAYADFSIMGVSAIFDDPEVVASTDYVVGDEEAMSVIVFYIVTIVMYLPAIVRAIRNLSSIEAPNWGQFEKRPYAYIQAPAPVYAGSYQAAPYGAYAPVPGGGQTVVGVGVPGVTMGGQTAAATGVPGVTTGGQTVAATGVPGVPAGYAPVPGGVQVPGAPGMPTGYTGVPTGGQVGGVPTGYAPAAGNEQLRGVAGAQPGYVPPAQNPAMPETVQAYGTPVQTPAYPSAQVPGVPMGAPAYPPANLIPVEEDIPTSGGDGGISPGSFSQIPFVPAPQVGEERVTTLINTVPPDQTQIDFDAPAQQVEADAVVADVQATEEQVVDASDTVDQGSQVASSAVEQSIEEVAVDSQQAVADAPYADDQAADEAPNGSEQGVDEVRGDSDL